MCALLLLLFYSHTIRNYICVRGGSGKVERESEWEAEWDSMSRVKSRRRILRRCACSMCVLLASFNICARINEILLIIHTNNSYKTATSATKTTSAKHIGGGNLGASTKCSSIPCKTSGILLDIRSRIRAHISHAIPPYSCNTTSILASYVAYHIFCVCACVLFLINRICWKYIIFGGATFARYERYFENHWHILYYSSAQPRDMPFSW